MSSSVPSGHQKPAKRTFRSSVQDSLRTAALNLKNKAKVYAVLPSGDASHVSIPDTDGVPTRTPTTAGNLSHYDALPPIPSPLPTSGRGLSNGDARNARLEADTRLEVSTPAAVASKAVKRLTPSSPSMYRNPTLRLASMSTPCLPMPVDSASNVGAVLTHEVVFDKMSIPSGPGMAARHARSPPQALRSAQYLSGPPKLPIHEASDSPSGPNPPAMRRFSNDTSRANRTFRSPLNTQGSSTPRRESPAPPSAYNERPRGGSSPPESPTRPRRSTSATPSLPGDSSKQGSPLYTHNNTSTASVISAHREAIRTAISYLVKELGRPIPRTQQAGLAESERRLRPLIRMERLWGNRLGGGYAAAATMQTVPGEKERRAFCEALRDGYILCQLMNKLQPGAISRVDEREDGVQRATNVLKFLKAASRYGVHPSDLFQAEDLRHGSPEALHRVAATLLSLSGAVSSTSTHPYSSRKATVASMSSPDLLPVTRCFKPPSAISGAAQPLPPPAKLSVSIPVKPGTPTSDPIKRDSVMRHRVSIAASSTPSETTTAHDSLLDSKSTKFSTMRTANTDATSLPSNMPSLSRAEGERVAQQGPFAEACNRLDAPYPLNLVSNFAPPPLDIQRIRKDRRSSEIRPDLARVAEEGEDMNALWRRNRAISASKNSSNTARTGARDYADPKTLQTGGVRGSAAGLFNHSPGSARSGQDATGEDTLQPIYVPLDPRGIEPSALLLRRTAIQMETSASDHTAKHTPKHLVTTAARSDAFVSSRDLPTVHVPFPVGPESPRLPSSGPPKLPRNQPRVFQGASNAPIGEGHSAKSALRTRRRSEIEIPLATRSNFVDDLPVYARRPRHESLNSVGGRYSMSDAGSRGSSIISGFSLATKQVIVISEGELSTHYQLGNCIGRGQFGAVYRALNLDTGQTVAVKRIRLDGHSESEVAQLMREVDLLKSLSHPSIVRYQGMARDTNALNIVLEYVENGSLGQTLKAFGKLNEGLIASYVFKILEGLHYLHECQVVHCDLKAANILTTKNGNIKLTDFGVSLNLRAVENISNDAVGTPNWMAPEVIELKGASPASDIWSLGCVIIELWTGKPPYWDIQNGLSVMFRIVDGEGPGIPDDCSDTMKSFLHLCFQKDPQKRPTAEYLFEHDWLKQSWGAYKELRPQDSIPFLRRVSVELQRSDIARQISVVDPWESRPSESPSTVSPFPLPASPQTETSPSPSPIPAVHSYVETTFAKAMMCRVCGQLIQTGALFCEDCGLISHDTCAAGRTPPCFRMSPFGYAVSSERSEGESPTSISPKWISAPRAEPSYFGPAPSSTAVTTTSSHLQSITSASTKNDARNDAPLYVAGLPQGEERTVNRPASSSRRHTAHGIGPSSASEHVPLSLQSDSHNFAVVPPLSPSAKAVQRSSTHTQSSRNVQLKRQGKVSNSRSGECVVQ